ncbi:universal stress protein [Paractinoplanes atraurantiacus]|uniref:Nucleotide-binding universal stress protein, UspA family n=1 Tax=Paractinoplanes atraurantiacus TaxID=1036182 RepID=A0A285JK96_9ACTN|nr:universal stress protein [Actinoplanes atraurantiacus]SNY59521.1 Nucleotide-binding universal stress protein, UspA family [Actinoplanes atraurantiacus]
MNTRPVIVATDGTDCSAIAVDWAAHEARRRHLPLRIVHAFDWDWQDARYDFKGELVIIARKIAEAIVAAAWDRAREIAPDITIETDTLTGHAAPRLLEVSRGAELLVLGSRGRGGFTGLLLGSVSQRVATHAAGPVVVVRGHATAPSGPIAAGVDDSPAADLVLETAFTTAAGQGCPLTIVRAYLPVIPLWLSDVAPPTVDTPQQDAAETERLEEQLAPWRAKYPGVPVKTVVTHESAAFALERESRHARLVVVGNRGHGLLAGAFLGSTTLQLLYHAACPVLITRPQPA